MLVDLHGRAKLHEFLLTWLRADHGQDLNRDPKKFPVCPMCQEVFDGMPPGDDGDSDKD